MGWLQLWVWVKLWVGKGWWVGRGGWVGGGTCRLNWKWRGTGYVHGVGLGQQLAASLEGWLTDMLNA